MSKKAQEKEVDEFLEQILPVIKQLAPAIVEYQKVRSPLVKRNQIINGVVMLSILASVVFLAIYQIIDGSAATGLIGAIIGYVFGGLYQSRQTR